MSTLTKDEWIARAAAHFVKRAALTPERARECAEGCHDNREPDYSPEESVDEELACWDE